MSWHNLDINAKTLEAETVNNVYENIVFLKDRLEFKGKTVDTLTEVSAEIGTQIYEIANILEGIEDDITKLNDVTMSVYYGVPWELNPYFTKTDYQRWVLVLNDLYDIIYMNKGQWAQMYLTQETGEPDVQDIDGNDIYIRGDTIG